MTAVIKLPCAIWSGCTQKGKLCVVRGIASLVVGADGIDIVIGVQSLDHFVETFVDIVACGLHHDRLDQATLLDAQFAQQNTGAFGKGPGGKIAPMLGL